MTSSTWAMLLARTSIPLLAGLAGVADVAIARQTAPRSSPVLVRAVLDGDTIDVAGHGRVGLLGIDAPELGRGAERPAPFADEARERLASLVGARWVRLEYEATGHAASSRRRAYVLLETGVLVNAVLVREGLACVAAPSGLSRLGELQRAESEARAWNRGIWRVRDHPLRCTRTAAAIHGRAIRPHSSWSVMPAPKRIAY